MKPTVTQDVSTALRARFGHYDLTPIADGEDSLAFRLETPHRSLVLRLNIDRAGFDKDAWAAQTFPSLPIPPILEIFPVGLSWACLSTLAPGVPFQRVPPADLPNAAVAVASALAEIHRADISRSSGFGAIDASGNGTESNWPGFISNLPDEPASPLQSDPVYHRARAAIAAYPIPQTPPRVLIHGDFGGGNIILDGARTAIIDWSEALYGDPAYDIANVHFWRPWLVCLQALVPRLDPTTDPQLLMLYQVRIGAQNMLEYAQAADGTGLAWVRARTAECLDQLRP